jgi:hypothetical protein
MSHSALASTDSSRSPRSLQSAIHRHHHTGRTSSCEEGSIRPASLALLNYHSTTQSCQQHRRKPSRSAHCCSRFDCQSCRRTGASATTSGRPECAALLRVNGIDPSRARVPNQEVGWPHQVWPLQSDHCCEEECFGPALRTLWSPLAGSLSRTHSYACQEDTAVVGYVSVYG